MDCINDSLKRTVAINTRTSQKSRVDGIDSKTNEMLLDVDVDLDRADKSDIASNHMDQQQLPSAPR